MTTSIDHISTPPRIAEAGEALTLEELALAGRNHALPAEALRYDVSPPGLHYVLNHFDIPSVDADAWRLEIGGLVERPLSLDLETLQDLPRHTVRVTMECAGNGRAHLSPRPVSQPWLTGAVGTAEWTGVPLADLLEDAGVLPGAVDVAFTGSDHGVERGVEENYRRGLTLAEATAADVLVAYAMNGAELPPQHGFPARLVVPGWYGMAHVKWLAGIEVLDAPFDGFQNTVNYRLRTDPEEQGAPVTRIEPRALLAPPGFPDFMSRVRVVRTGPCPLEGRAWSGWGKVSAVEVSADGGTTWWEAEVETSGHNHAWQGFRTSWEATPGEHLLCARAHDATGRSQPATPVWSRGGFANNAVDIVRVLVPDEPAG
jgi:DMSO/TMAO reductase YedYZ molybdopterin-dependent catalytic subunit